LFITFICFYSLLQKGCLFHRVEKIERKKPTEKKSESKGKKDKESPKSGKSDKKTSKEPAGSGDHTSEEVGLRWSDKLLHHAPLQPFEQLN
jgi:hypothetical protein